jgi:hypothetical protein
MCPKRFTLDTRQTLQNLIPYDLLSFLPFMNVLFIAFSWATVVKAKFNIFLMYILLDISKGVLKSKSNS